MAMQARQDWGTGMLELQPHKGGNKGKAIHIDLKDGKHESLDLETSVDEFSSSDYSTSEEESTITNDSDSSQAEIMGVVLTNPNMWIAPLQESNYTMQVGSSSSLASMLTHECYEETINLVSPKVDQGKEVVLLREACLPYLDGVYTLKLNKAAIGIAIYNEKGAKLFGMDLVVDRSVFFDALLQATQVEVPWICGNQSLITKTWRGGESMKDFTTVVQPLPTKDNQKSSTPAANEPLYEVITKETTLKGSLSQARKICLDTLHLLEIEAFPKVPNKRRRWLIRKATSRYKAAIGIAIYNEKEAKLFGMDLVVDRSVFFDALLQATQVEVPWICGNQSLITKAWRGGESVKDFITIVQSLPTKDNQKASTHAANEPLYEVITKETTLKGSLSQARKIWLDTLHLLEIEAFPKDPNKRRRWLIRKATSRCTATLAFICQPKELCFPPLHSTGPLCSRRNVSLSSTHGPGCNGACYGDTALSSNCKFAIHHVHQRQSKVPPQRSTAQANPL
ncbi:hypothetical protein L7F22_028487 [Adiantum nelumboides]|nr:hypothetical protein [Adiantum nelumboides]